MHPNHFWFHTGCYGKKYALCIQTQVHQQFKEMSQRYFGSLFILFKKFKCPCAVVLNSGILFDWKVGYELTRLVEPDNRIWNYHLSMKWNDAVFVPDRPIVIIIFLVKFTASYMSFFTILFIVFFKYLLEKLRTFAIKSCEHVMTQ